MKKAPILTLILCGGIAACWHSMKTVDAQSEAVEKSRKTAQNQATSRSPTPHQAGESTSNRSDAQVVDVKATTILKKARRKLRSYESVKASLIQSVVVGDRRFRAQGTYLQGQNFQLRMSLEFALGRDGQFQASMLQVCDGQVLWTSHRHGRTLPKQTAPGKSDADSGIVHRITRRDVRQILHEAARHQQVRRSLVPAELGLGGISELLSSLEQTMAFGKVRSEQIDGKPFLVFQGRWNINVLKNFLSEQELEKLRQNDDARRLPDLPKHVPDMVRLYFDRDSLFPRRVLYLKRRESANSLTPMISLSFVDVVLNGPVDVKQFNFVPPDKVFPQDITSNYIRDIREAAKSH